MSPPAAAAALAQGPNGRFRASHANVGVNQQDKRIPAAFQILLALYIILTGTFPIVVQALAFGLPGGATSEFVIASTTSFALEMLMIAPVLMLSRHPLGILHPLLLAVVVWPLLITMPSVIENFGGWAGVLAGQPVTTPLFLGLHSHAPSTVWLAMAKSNALDIAALVSTYLGFWLIIGTPNTTRIPPRFTDTGTMKTVLLGLIGLSLAVLIVFVYYRGGISAHLTSLGNGRFRELAGDGVVIVLTDFGAIALYLWVAAKPRDIITPLFLACFAAVAATQFISNGSRGSALLVPMTVGVIWAVRRQTIPWRLAVVLAPILFASIGLMGAIRSSNWSGQTAGQAFKQTTWSQSFVNAQQEISDRQSLSSQVPIVQRGFAVSSGPLLGESYIAAAVEIVPRSLWPDKPRGTGSLYAQKFIGASSEGASIPVSATAEMYWNFGLIGVLVLSFAYGMIIRKAYEFFWRRYPDPVITVFYVLFIKGFDISTKRFVDLEQQMGLLLICALLLAFFVPKAPPVEFAVRTANRQRNRLAASQ